MSLKFRTVPDGQPLAPENLICFLSPLCVCSLQACMCMFSWAPVCGCMGRYLCVHACQAMWSGRACLFYSTTQLSFSTPLAPVSLLVLKFPLGKHMALINSVGALLSPLEISVPPKKRCTAPYEHLTSCGLFKDSQNLSLHEVHPNCRLLRPLLIGGGVLRVALPS